MLEETQAAVCRAFEEAFNEFYPKGIDVEKADISKIVSAAAFNRLSGLLEKTQGKIVCGGQTDASIKFIAPTVVRDVAFDDALLERCVTFASDPAIPNLTSLIKRDFRAYSSDRACQGGSTRSLPGNVTHSLHYL